MDMKLGGLPGRWLLDFLTARFGPERWDSNVPPDPIAVGSARLEGRFGSSFFKEIDGAAVLDFGSGYGYDAMAAATRARTAYGFEIIQEHRASALSVARSLGLAGRCHFIDPIRERERVEELAGTFDLIYSIDAFEHFERPEEILAEMFRLLRPGGKLFVSFGPLWNHPYGAHLGHFNRLPWLHFIFSEQTIVEVREKYCGDGVCRMDDMAGGLNRMTVARFEKLLEHSPLQVNRLHLIPVKKLALLTRFRPLREYFTVIIEAELSKPGVPAGAGSLRADEPSLLS